MKKRVLITGATGFIGYHLIESALASNLEVYANVRKSSLAGHLDGFDINYVHLDFDSIYQMKKNIELYKYDYIIHAAGVTKAKGLKEYLHINATYSSNLAAAATLSAHRLEKFVFLSSLAALGPVGANNMLLNDDSPHCPVTNYGISKALAENYLSGYGNLPLIIFRPTAVYGPREKDIYILLRGISAGLELYIGNVQQSLSFIYVTDLTGAIIKSLSSDIVHKTYNISDGGVYNRFSLAGYARRFLNKKTVALEIPVPVIKGIAWSMECACRVINRVPALNVDKIKELTALNWNCEIKNLEQDLGFIPIYNLERGIDKTIKWYKENNWL